MVAYSTTRRSNTVALTDEPHEHHRAWTNTVQQTRWNKNIYQVPGLEFHENFGSKSGMSEHRFLLHAFSTMCFVHYSLRNLPGNFSNQSTNVFETDKKVVVDL